MMLRSLPIRAEMSLERAPIDSVVSRVNTVLKTPSIRMSMGSSSYDKKIFSIIASMRVVIY